MPYCQQIGWDDVPHLSEEQKADYLSRIPPHQRDARTRGVPLLGSGAIYPVPWSEVTVAPFQIPPYWPRAYALDVGWNRTAALWGAKDPADGTIYCYAEHYRGQEQAAVHAQAIRARGEWIKGAIDPSANRRVETDGEQLMAQYRDLGLKLTKANNAVESGLYEVWTALAIGRLKFFSTLQHTASEYQIYRRDERGRVVKKHDHLMDCLRYLVMTWPEIGAVQAPERTTQMTSVISDARAGY